MIFIENLTKRFHGQTQPAADKISVQIRTGCITGIVGPDGAGKTTLVRLIAGLLVADEGNISIFGLSPVADFAAVREILGYMPQRFGLYEDLTVLENLELYAEMRGLLQEQRQKRFAELLTFTGLKHFTRRLAGHLSGGMKQKLGLACALITVPKLLLLDEPSVGVDPISRRELWRMVREFVTGRSAVIWNTAYLDEAESCDDVLLLNEGKQLFFGKPAELTKQLEGHTVLIRHIPAHQRRRILTDYQKDPNVMDSTLQGNAVRLVFKTGNEPIPNAVAVAPRFEDGFIALLGGSTKTESVLAHRLRRPNHGNDIVVAAYHLSKKFGSFTAVHDHSFEIRRGEIFGFLGANGAGKSTTFRMLCGLLKPTQGDCFIAGYHLRKSPGKTRSRLGYMAQKFSMYGDLTVRQNLNFFAGTYGLWGFAKRRAVNEMLALFDLEQYASRSASVLPLGFKQRLSLAAALMHEPDVLFLDEPTSGVDPLTRREFWTHINALAESGVTVLITTHFMDEAEFCDRITLIEQGETIATGTPDALKQTVQDIPNPTLEDTFITLIQRKRGVSVP